MNQFELISQFVSDLQIEGCTVQASTLGWVFGNLLPKSYEDIIEKLKEEDGYLLGGVDPTIKNRASDDDVLKKNYFFLDFDIRQHLKTQDATEVSDTEVKEIGIGIIHSLNTHEALKNWRYLIFSGNGCHVYYFGDPVEVTSKEQWRSGMKRLHEAVKKCVDIPPDPGCINVGRISRIPGTYNWKNDRSVQVEILDFNDAVFDLSLIERAGKTIDSPQKAVTIENTIAEGSRNSTLTSLAGSLHHRGLDKETILASLEAVNAKRCNPPLDQRELNQVVESISKYTQKKLDSRSPLYRGSENRETVFNVQSVTELLLEPEEEHRWVVQDLLPTEGISIVVAKPKVGKSTEARNLAIAVARGNSYLDRPTTQGPVLYLALEEKKAEVRRHFQQMGVKDESIYIHVGPAPEDPIPQLEKLIEDHKPILVVIDPLFLLLRVKDLSNYTEVNNILEPLRYLAREGGCHILTTHHRTKMDQSGGDGILGSTAIFGAVDTAIMMSCRDGRRSMKSTQRYGVDLEETVIFFNSETGRTEPAGKISVIQQEEVERNIMLILHEEEMREVDIKDQVGGDQTKTAAALRALVDAGKVIRSGGGKRNDPFLYKSI
jgi:hypothetical protein